MHRVYPFYSSILSIYPFVFHLAARGYFQTPGEAQWFAWPSGPRWRVDSAHLFHPKGAKLVWGAWTKTSAPDTSQTLALNILILRETDDFSILILIFSFFDIIPIIQQFSVSKCDAPILRAPACPHHCINGSD